MPPPDLFISHSSGDADVARELRVALEAAGYTCWMAPDDVMGPVPWAEQILHAIESSRAMLVLISSHSNASTHVAREVSIASGRGRPVMPIRIEHVATEGSLEYHLAGLQRFDAFPPPITDHRDRILRRLNSIVPVQTPTQPGPAASTEPDTSPIATPAPPADETQPTQQPADGAEPPPPVVATPPVASPPPPVVAPPAPVDLPTEPLDAPRGDLQPVGIGTRIGAYEIQSVLGQGGMATVYRATQDEPKRAVALKLIRSDHAADPSYRERFLAEKDTLAALEHPSIVPIYAAGEVGGRLFIAMRLIDAPDLGARLATSGPMTLTDTVATLRPIADAIDYAHEMGVIHRDLKPSNVLVDKRGTPYLTDFGLGKNLSQPRGLTAAGTVFGTLDYMAPEQFSGVVDPALANRIDVYALGCLAYACLIGNPPFASSEPQQAMFAHMQTPPPSVVLARPDLPAALDGVIQRALAKNPAERFGSAREFISNLTAVQAAATDSQTRQIPVPPRPTTPSGLTAWARANTMLAGGIAAVAAIVLIGGAIVALGGGPDPSATPRRTQGAVITFQPTVGPTATPVGPTATPVVATPAPDAQAALLAMIPEEYRDSCTDPEYTPDATPPVASYVCFPTGIDFSIYYFRYANVTGLKDGYSYELDLYGTTPDTGACSDGENAESSWNFTGDPDDTERGRLLCDFNPDLESAWLMYTYEEALTLVEVAGDDLKAAFEFWKTGDLHPDPDASP